MFRYHVLKDGSIVCTTSTRESAIDMIRQYQSKETHYMLRASFSIIAGEEELIDYPRVKKSKKATA
jgi:hypothetical protein